MKITELIDKRDLVTIGATRRLGEAAELMREHRISGIPVVDEAGSLAGIVTIGQILHLAQDGDEPRRLLDPEWRSPVTTQPSTGGWERRSLDEVMIRDVVTVPGDVDCRTGARTLVDAEVHRAVVVDTARRPVAMVTSLDFTRLVADAGGGDASERSVGSDG